MKRNSRTIKLIKLYQKHKRISGRCHFIPSCSNYAIEAYSKFNWFYASFLTGFRILRCTPFTKRRVDLVPLSREEKERNKVLAELKEKYDQVFIDTVLKQSRLYPNMNSYDYYILTLEYLFGYNHFKEVKMLIFEQIGIDYIRIGENIPTCYKEIDSVKINKYINIINTLNQYGFIKYGNPEYTSISKNYPHGYLVVPTENITLDIWARKLKEFCDSPNFIIGMENIPLDKLEFFKNIWNALVVDGQDILKKKAKILDNTKPIIVVGDNLSNPTIAYHLNCLVTFYSGKKIDINKYNFIIK